MENPAKYMMKKVDMSDIGISISGRMAISQFLKKKKITRITSKIDISKVSFTSVSDRRTFSVLSIKVVNVISPFCDFLISSSRLVNSSEILM